MKFVKYLFVLVLAISLNAFAAMSPKEIGQLIDSGQLVQAEAAMQEVLKTRDTAKVHYLLAQVYQQMRRNVDAKNELAKADAMDPTHSYTTNDKYQAQAAKILGTTTAAPVVVTQAAPPQRQVITSPSKPSEPIDGSAVAKVFGYIFGIAFVIALMFYIVIAVGKRREKAQLQEELEKDIAALQARVATLVYTADNALLEAKTAPTPISSKINAIGTIKAKVLELYDRAKNETIADANECATMMTECRSLELSLNTVSLKNYGAAPVVEEVVQPEPAKRPALKPEYRQRPPAPPAQSVPQPTHTTHRETVVVNQGSTLNDVLVTSVLLDSMNHNHRNEDYERQQRDDRLREREAEDRRQREQDAEDRRERQREAERQAREDREEEARQSTWSSPVSDSGNDDNWSSPSSSDSGSDNNW